MPATRCPPGRGGRRSPWLKSDPPRAASHERATEDAETQRTIGNLRVSECGFLSRRGHFGDPFGRRSGADGRTALASAVEADRHSRPRPAREYVAGRSAGAISKLVDALPWVCATTRRNLCCCCWSSTRSPTLLAAIGDVALPSWRASAVGVCRSWRDLGYAIGALLAGVTADAIGLPGAMWLVAGITLMSGAVAAVRMDDTRHVSTA